MAVTTKSRSQLTGRTCFGCGYPAWTTPATFVWATMSSSRCGVGIKTMSASRPFVCFVYVRKLPALYFFFLSFLFSRKKWSNCFVSNRPQSLLIVFIVLKNVLGAFAETFFFFACFDTASSPHFCCTIKGVVLVFRLLFWSYVFFPFVVACSHVIGGVS